MLPLTNLFDGLVMFFIAGVAGALGGLGYEMLLKPEQEGRVRLPHKESANTWNAGVIASLYLGGIAGIAITIIALPFDTITKSLDDGTTQSIQQYAFWRLAVLALIAGTAGPATIRSAQNVLDARKAVNEAEQDKKVAVTEKEQAEQDKKVAVTEKIQAVDEKEKALTTAKAVTEQSALVLEKAKQDVSDEIELNKQTLLQMFGKAKNQIPSDLGVKLAEAARPDSIDLEVLQRAIAAETSQNNVVDSDVMNVLDKVKQDATELLDDAISKIRATSFPTSP